MMELVSTISNRYNLFAGAVVAEYTNNLGYGTAIQIQMTIGTTATEGRLSGAGGYYKVELLLDDMQALGSPIEKEFGNEYVYHTWTHRILIPSGSTVKIKITSFNSFETSVLVSSKIYNTEVPIEIPDIENVEISPSSIAQIIEGVSESLSEVNIDQNAIDNIVSGIIHSPELSRLTAGTGPIRYIYTVYSPEDVLPNVMVYLYNSSELKSVNLVAFGITDNFGRVIFYLDKGEYYAVRVKAGYTFENPIRIEVSSEEPHEE